MQQDMRNNQPEQAIEAASIKGALTGVVAAVDADAELVKQLARPDASYTISSGQIVQTPSAEVPESHLTGQEIAAGPTNSEPTTHEPPARDDDSVSYSVPTRTMTLESGQANEPLILGGEGSNSPATIKAPAFTIASSTPGTAVGRAA